MIWAFLAIFSLSMFYALLEAVRSIALARQPDGERARSLVCPATLGFSAAQPSGWAVPSRTTASAIFSRQNRRRHTLGKWLVINRQLT